MYEKLLPRIGLPRLQFYGYIEEDDSRFGWLFMGDAGGAKPTMADRSLVAEWLARLQTGAAGLSGNWSLPGTNYGTGTVAVATPPRVCPMVFSDSATNARPRDGSARTRCRRSPASAISRPSSRADSA